MDLQADLLSDLRLLASSADLDEGGLVGSATELVASLAAAIDGYAGLQLTVVQQVCPVTVTEMRVGTDLPVVTSLRIPLSLGPVGSGDGSHAIIYSSTSGSLVDLAADVSYTFRQLDHAPHRNRTGVVLDADLPATGTPSGITGLDELEAVDRAVGFLLGEGHDPDTVHDTLRRQASSAGLGVPAFAARLLRR